MGTVWALGITAGSGVLLLALSACIALMFRPLRAARLWALATLLAGLAGLEVLLGGTVSSPFFRAWDLFFTTVEVLACELSLVLGFLDWLEASTGKGHLVLVRNLLWGGSILALIPVALGQTQSDWAAWLWTASWSTVPVGISMVVLGRQLAREPKGAKRSQIFGLQTALLTGWAPYVLSWIVLPSFPELGWRSGFLPFLLWGQLVLVRTLLRYDTRFPYHRTAPFLVEKTRDTVLFLGPDGRIQALNPALKSLLDTDEEQLTGQPLSVLGADEESCRLLAPLESLAWADWEGYLALAHRTGRAVAVRVVFHRVHNPAREAVGAVLLLSNQTEADEQGLGGREDLETSLASKRWVLELLEAEFQRVKRYGGVLSALWIRVPGASTDLLRRVGAILQGSLRKTDFCGRVGEAEFLAVLPATTSERTVLVRDRVQRMFDVATDDEPSTAFEVATATLLDSEPTSRDYLQRLQASLPAPNKKGQA